MIATQVQYSFQEMIDFESIEQLINVTLFMHSMRKNMKKAIPFGQCVTKC